MGAQQCTNNHNQSIHAGYIEGKQYALPSKTPREPTLAETELQKLEKKFHEEIDIAEEGVEFDEKYWHIHDKDVDYRGHWKNSRPHGSGRFYINNGCIVSCICREGRIINRFDSIWINARGDRYVGSISDDKFQFQGKGTFQTYKQPKVLQYYGEWHRNKPHGHGTQIFQEKKSDGSLIRATYEGSFDNGVKYGRNQKYKVEKVNGSGTPALTTLWSYQGQFKDNYFSGKGALSSDRQLDEVQGEFGQLQGRSIFEKSTIRQDPYVFRSKICQKQYTADCDILVDQDYHTANYCCLESSKPDEKGLKFIGPLKDGLLHGKGQVIGKDGSKEEVYWFQGVQLNKAYVLDTPETEVMREILGSLEKHYQSLGKYSQIVNRMNREYQGKLHFETVEGEDEKIEESEKVVLQMKIGDKTFRATDIGLNLQKSKLSQTETKYTVQNNESKMVDQSDIKMRIVDGERKHRVEITEPNNVPNRDRVVFDEVA